jgi:hypothetical protein
LSQLLMTAGESKKGMDWNELAPPPGHGWFAVSELQ